MRGSLFIYSQKNLNNMQKKLQLLLALLAFVVTSAMAQITTSGISGKISSNGETVIGATVTATHQIGRAHVWTPVTFRSRMPSSAWKKKKKKQKNKKKIH